MELVFVIAVRVCRCMCFVKTMWVRLFHCSGQLSVVELEFVRIVGAFVFSFVQIVCVVCLMLRNLFYYNQRVRLFQATGQLGGPRGDSAAAAGGVSCSAGGTFPPEEDQTGCLPAAPHPAAVHAGGNWDLHDITSSSCQRVKGQTPSSCVL